MYNTIPYHLILKLSKTTTDFVSLKLGHYCAVVEFDAYHDAWRVG